LQSNWIFALAICNSARPEYAARSPMEDWNDLRLLLAVTRTRSIVGAAKTLGIDHSTVFRRLNALEKKLGVRLFERLPGGLYQPTAGGDRTAAAAESMEHEALALDRDIAGRDHKLVGRLRVTSSETLAYRLLTPHLAEFRRAHPRIVVEFTVDNRILDLSRREADVALRPQRPKESYLWGRKIAGVAWTVYGARTYLNANGLPTSTKDLRRYSLIGWDEMAARFGAARWLERTAPADAFIYRTASLVNQLHAAKAGIGLAALPCYLGDPESELTRALPSPPPELATELWIVTHADLKNTGRVRAFFDLIGERLARQRDLFEGRRPASQRGSSARSRKGRSAKGN
jgi:DNA-binding transcriptional LysR family regulator